MKKKAKPKNELMVVGRELMVIDNGVLDFVSTTMESKVIQLSDEVSKLHDQLITNNIAIGKVLHSFSFEFKDIAEQLRVLTNHLAALHARPPIDEGVDPLSGRDEEGNLDPFIEEQMRRKAEADERYVEEVKASNDGKTLERECKKLFRRISSACHPDKVRDKSLHPVFEMAVKAMDDLNLQLLQQFWHDVSGYIKLRSNNKNFQAYLAKKLAKAERDLKIVNEELEKQKQTNGYKVLEASRTHDKKRRRRAYDAFIQEQCMQVRKLIAEAQRKASPLSGFSFNFNSNR